ncbi:MAG: zf-HC2 domain-containing protein [Oscillospiraceae bacterium]|nr:zf-HC2 domain-containing protein [Oscillospiraceae bacterium]
MAHRCECYNEQMSAALDGELSAGERRELDAHLAVCPDCAALFERLSRHSAALRALECQTPTGLKDSILSRLPPQPSPAEEPKPSPGAQPASKKAPVSLWRRWGGLAACAALVLAVGLPFARLMLTPMGSGGNGAAAPAQLQIRHTASDPAEGEPVSGRGDAQVEVFCPDYALTSDQTSPGASPDNGAALSDGAAGSSGAVPHKTDTDTDPAFPTADSKSLRQYGGTSVAAVLTLSAIPEDWERYWSAEDVQELDDGTLYCLVPGQVVDALIGWAAESAAVSASLTDGPYGPDALCAVCWENP